MTESLSDRQAAYAAWRDRLRTKDDVIDLDAEPVVAERPSGEDWSQAGLFRSSTLEQAGESVTEP